jgi:hypothetical protein
MCLALTKKLRIAPRVFISGHPLLFLFLFFKISQQVYFTGTFSDRKTRSKFLDLKNWIFSSFLLENTFKTQYKSWKKKKLTNPITPQNHPQSENQMIKAHLNGSRSTFFGIFKEKTIFIELFHIIETHWCQDHNF